MALLKNQEFEKGFELHKLRWKIDNHKNEFLQSSKPLWNGQKNKLFFYGKNKASVTKLKVQCDKRLIPLFKRSFHKEITFCNGGSTVADTHYDFHTSVALLPRIFRKSLNTLLTLSEFLLCAHSILKGFSIG